MRLPSRMQTCVGRPWGYLRGCPLVSQWFANSGRWGQTAADVDGPYHALTGFRRTTLTEGCKMSGAVLGALSARVVFDLDVPMSNKSKE
jgi:hypothetical protein